MDGLGLLGLIVLGGLAGWIGSIITKTNAEHGLFGNIVAGIIGAFVGGFLFNLFGGAGVTGFNLWSFVVALIGSIIVLLIWRAIARRSV